MRLERLAAAGRRPLAVGVSGGAATAVEAVLLAKAGRPALVVCETPEAAERRWADLRGMFAEVMLFPPLEAVFGELGEIDESSAERMAVLERLAGHPEGEFVVVTSLLAFADKVTPPSRLAEHSLTLAVGHEVDLAGLAATLERFGYDRVPMVEARGQFSVRGGILDVFPVTAEEPYRIELFGDTVESVRRFDVASQRSTAEVRAMVALPRRHMDTGGEATLLDYLPPSTLVVLEEPTGAAHSLTRAAAAREGGGALLGAEACLGALSASDPVVLASLAQSAPGLATGPSVEFPFAQPPSFGRDLERMREEVSRLLDEGTGVVLCAVSEPEAARLREILEDVRLEGHPLLAVETASLESGFLVPGLSLCFLTDQEVFARYRRPRPRRTFRGGAPVLNVYELEPGEPVVHARHGIGRFLGIQNIEVAGKRADYVAVEYAGGDRLYVPLDELGLLERYVGGEAPALSRLGGAAWERAKARARRSARDMAKELIEIHARRETAVRTPHPPDNKWQHEFESAFPYEETEGQYRAIAEIKADMERPRPMDRLLCGDVGFGKTEVAVRAAFKAVMGGRQVAVLVPTTILAEQHNQTFSDRMAPYPIRVEVLSRFTPRKKEKEVLEGLRSGAVDVVIGTHRLLSPDVCFKDLGLVVVDEEQRFGVAHKERLKRLRATVDVLSLSATPIPRTLYMALVGLRDISVIDTPPQDRLPVSTHVVEWNPQVIRDAVMRELVRGGQVFYVHNRVEEIEEAASRLARLVPQARIATAHGQMSSRELERAMLRFVRREVDVLVCTTIVESGLDIPNANTMIVERADRFGLADLYQLRGRVGRFRWRAYCYLLIPPAHALSDAARKRLLAIREFTALGSGFNLAMRDLEIRGAGNLLGPEQHGHMQAIGFDMYCQLLREAVEELKGEVPKEAPMPALELGLEAYLPDAYVPDHKQKLALYKRLAAAREEEEVLAIAEELRDRFGPLPREAQALVEVFRVRLAAWRSGFGRLSREGKVIRMRPREGAGLALARAVPILERYAARVGFGGDGSVTLRVDGDHWLPELLVFLRECGACGIIATEGA